MRLRIGQVQGRRLLGHEADETFARAQYRQMHGLPAQAFGGVKLEAPVHAQDVDGTHLRHHVGGDHHHDLVEAFLRADRLRHHFAEPSQKYARTAERATHGPHPFPGAARPGWRLETHADFAARYRSSPYSECKVRTASSV